MMTTSTTGFTYLLEARKGMGEVDSIESFFWFYWGLKSEFKATRKDGPILIGPNGDEYYVFPNGRMKVIVEGGNVFWSRAFKKGIQAQCI